MRFPFAFPAALAAVLFSASFATAEDNVDPPVAPVTVKKARVLVFGDGVAQFHVERDVAARRMTFRQADPALRLDGAPVVVVSSPTGPKEVALMAVEGQPGVWTWSHEAVATTRFDGTMRVVVAGKPYTSPLASVWTRARAACRAARYGGRLMALPDCGAEVEVVQDLRTGTLTIYSFEDVVVTEAPVLTVTQDGGPAEITMTRVAGKDGVWVTKHELLRTTTTKAHIRLLVNGKPCETPLVYASNRGGHLVRVTDGPSLEVVRDAQGGTTTFYAVDETYNGKPYTVENPTVVIGGRTYQMTPVAGEPRAWRAVGLDTAGSDATDGQLNFTLFGKTLSTRLGLSGLGVNVR